MNRKIKHLIAWVVLAALAVACALGYYKFFWVFSDGTKTGELNSLTYTGYLFKTYEGEMILTGYGNKGTAAGGTVQSKNFKFSVADKAVAEQLNRLTGQRVTVHFKEYKGTLPWRGYERSIVDRIENAEPVESTSGAAGSPLPFDTAVAPEFL